MQLLNPQLDACQLSFQEHPRFKIYKSDSLNSLTNWKLFNECRLAKKIKFFNELLELLEFVFD